MEQPCRSRLGVGRGVKVAETNTVSAFHHHHRRYIVVDGRGGSLGCVGMKLDVLGISRQKGSQQHKPFFSK